MPLSFLLDEHVPSIYRRELARRQPGMVVRSVGGPSAPSLGTLDPDILAWCERHGFALVTSNRRSMPRHLADHLAAGRHVPGIFVLSRRMGVGDVLDDLVLIWSASEEGEYWDLILHLPL